MKLLSKEKIGFSNDKFEKLSWDKFEKLSNIIVNDIFISNFHLEKVSLLGIARGALPLLSYVSHHTKIRDLSICQLKMTNSDKPFDYGTSSILLKAIRNDFDKFILFEDIIFRGQTIKLVQDELYKENKAILAIYSLLVDESYENQFITAQVRSAALVKQNHWVKFPWESDEL
jgi:hypoxanthine-guanine phosphoribosyltransferase